MAQFMPVEADIPDFPEYVLMSNQLPTAQNYDLYNAAAAGDINLVEAALKNGGKPNFFNVSQDQKSSLHIAAENGHTDVVRLLLQRGAKINSTIGTTKAIALTIAAGKNHVNVIRELLLSVPPPDLYHRNGYGNSALHEVARGGFSEAALLLLQHGKRPPSTLSPSSSSSPAPASVPASPLVSIVNNKGSTPLHFLCYSESSSEEALLVAEALLLYGSDVNASDTRGFTPFLVCCSTGRVDLMVFLVNKGADCGAKTAKGESAFEVASFYKQQHLFPLFESYQIKK